MKLTNRTWTFARVLLVVSLTISACTLGCSDEIEISLGNFSSMDEGNRMSIKKLSDVTRRCPKANQYRIFWKVVTNGQEVGRRAALYKRGYGVGYEQDPYSGFSSEVYAVNDDAIHVVAQTGGTFEDFANYHQSTK